MSQAQIRVVVSSRTPAVRAGLRELLSGAGFDVSGAVATEALLDEHVEEVDVLVIDLGEDRELRGALDLDLAEVPAVLLTDRVGPTRQEGAARAWLPPDASEDALAAAVFAVASGLTVYAPEFAPGSDAVSVAGRIAGEVASITDREREVLALLATGLPNKAIARRLDISEHTVKFHVGSLLSKLDAQSRTEAVTIAARQGLLTL